MARVIHEVRLPDLNGELRASDGESLLQGVVARIFIRRDASHQSLREIAAFLKRTAVGRYAIGRTGSVGSGYWLTIDVMDRRDLDRLRRQVPRLIDGWKELV